jgi:S1-C subfamily serine protease
MSSGTWAAFVAGIATCTIAVLLVGAFSPRPPTLTETDVRTAVERALASQVPGPALSALVYQVITPSLVLVRTDRFQEQGDRGVGLGSAILVSTEGHILTAHHVVDGSDAVDLTFADGSTSTASLVLADEERDIAVLRAERMPADAVPAVLGNPGSLRIGSEAFIVGHPYGLVGSLSSGVISGLDRTFRRPGTDRVLTGLIQVDAAVNPGNSGGPVLDRAGHVVGIVTALLNPTNDDVFIGIGLAVPIDVAAGAAGLPPY